MTTVTKTAAATDGHAPANHNVSKIAQSFDRVADGFRKDPASAKQTFTVYSEQTEGLRSEIEVRDFLFTVDEPSSLGGSDAGPNPIELVLSAIASCQEITYRLYAEKLGISLSRVSTRVSGKIDLCGLFAVDAGARPGLEGLEIDVELESDASDAEIERLKRTVDAHCPVLDILRNATPVSARTNVLGRDHALAGAADDGPLFAGLAG